MGTITERQKTVKGYRYLVKTEDGRDIEDLYVDDNSYTSSACGISVRGYLGGYSVVLLADIGGY